MRVNARLDTATEHPLDDLTDATGKSVSHVRRGSVGRYCFKVRREAGMPSRFLALVGQGRSGHAGTAGDVKARFDEALAAKGAPAAARRRP